jgi:D-methionine transport system ATP-binding protein
MIKLENIRKTFRARDGAAEGGAVQALRGVSLEVGRGEIFGIIGRSGAGKSTLIRCINLLERPDPGGRVVVDGEELTQLSEAALRAARHRIGMIFQHFNLLSSRSVFGNVALPLELAGVPKREIEPRVARLLDLVGLTDKRDEYPAKLSGGQKQRVGIARALASEPKVLLCDEATSALDPQTTRSILALLADINRRLGLTIVLITHEMAVVKEICDRVAVLQDGAVVETGEVFDIFTRPRHATTHDFVRLARGEDRLPASYEARLSLVPLVGGAVVARIIFTGAAARQPVISDLVRNCDVEVNILHGDIEYIRDRPFGTLLVELTGSAERAINFLKAKNLHIEIVGYVANDARAAG